MRRNKKKISPRSKYNAVLDLMSGKGTLEKIAKQYNMSVTTLWKYNANVDAAIRNVVGFEENCSPYRDSTEYPSIKMSQDDTHKNDVEYHKAQKKTGELIIRINY